MAVSLLSGDAGLALVERDRVEAAAGEAAVQKMLAAGPAAADRARVGEILGARLLALVHLKDGKLRP